MFVGIGESQPNFAVDEERKKLACIALREHKWFAIRRFRVGAPARFEVWTSVPNKIFRGLYDIRVTFSPSHGTISGVSFLSQFSLTTHDKTPQKGIWTMSRGLVHRLFWLKIFLSEDCGWTCCEDIIYSRVCVYACESGLYGLESNKVNSTNNQTWRTQWMNGDQTNTQPQIRNYCQSTRKIHWIVQTLNSRMLRPVITPWMMYSI